MIPVRRSSIVRRSSLQEDPYVRGLYDFFYGETWSRNLTSFIHAHCSVFELDLDDPSDSSSSSESKYDHGHYEVFQQFKDWVFLLLNTHFSDLGIDEDHFTSICEKELVLQQTEHSYRFTFVIQYLRTLTDFNEFAEIMRDAAEKKRLQASHQQELNMKEWELQCALAQSLVHAKQDGHLEDRDEALLPWAEAVLNLENLMQQYGMKERYDVDLEAEDSPIGVASNLLRRERMKVDIEVAKRMQETNQSLKKQIPSLQHVHQCLGETTANTPLVNLLEASGKVELALSSYKNKVRSHRSIQKEQREKLYLSIREITKSKPFPLLGPKQISKIQGMLAKYGGSKLHSSIVEDFVHLIWLENHHHHLCKRIQREVDNPTAAAPDSSQPIPHGSAHPSPSPSSSTSTPQPQRKRSLTINTSQEDSAKFSLDQIETFSEDLRKSSRARTPKEARQAMELMEEELKRITAKQELERVRLSMLKNASQAQQQSGEQKAKTLQHAQKLGTDYTRLQAMTDAELGDEMIYPLEESETTGDEALPAVTNYDSDCTEEDDEEEVQPKDKPSELLHKTERLRRELLIRGQSHARSMGRQPGIVLNSPKYRAQGGISFPVGVNGSAAGKSGESVQRAQPLPDNYGTAKLSVNPTSLRFLASHVADYRSNSPAK